jgi:competence protein ComEC
VNPLVAPVTAFALGIVAARVIAFGSLELCATIVAFFVLGFIAMRRGSRVLTAACCLLGLFAAGALTLLAHAPQPSPELTAEGREIVILSGCVVEPPAISGERERFILELEPHTRAQVTLYSRNGELLPALRYGQNIELDARVRKARNFGNPGAFDYVHYLARQEIYWTASGAAGDLRILPGKCGSRFQKTVMDLRQTALQRIDRLYGGDSYKSGMMQAILIGQTYQLQKVWTEDYRSTGTFHALVISGTHVAVLAAFFLFLLRICLVPKGLALTLTVFASWIYALVTGWQAPCVRAAAGMTLYTIGSYFYRERRSMNLLAAVALGFLVFDPEQLFEASFQLTFLAVGFLAAFAAPLIAATSGPLAHGLRGIADADRDPRLDPRVAQFRIEIRLLGETIARLSRIPQRFATRAIASLATVVLLIVEVIAVSAVVQIGLALPMVEYFHRVGISGLSANALVVPLMGLVVPLGFVAVFTGWTWIANIAGGMLALSEHVVHIHAALEPNWRIPTPPVWLAIAIAAALIAAAMARGRWRIATGLAVAALLAILFWEPFPPATHPGQLEMTAIDVGQGDSILLVFPDGKRLLVDGGGLPAFGHTPRSNLDIGEDVVAPYLWDRGFHRLDAVALSHAHEDHIGGLAALIADFRPKELWTGATPESPAWNAVRQQAGRRGVDVLPMTAPHRFAFGGAEIEVLAPLPDYVPSATPKNNDSLVMRVCYGRHSFLLSGDVERQVEGRMLAENEVQHDDVLKVAHHGSRTSTTEEFLSAVAPTFAVISAGYENSYGHPHRDIVDRLARHGAMVLRTDRQGLITIRSDGRRLDLETYNGFLNQR